MHYDATEPIEHSGGDASRGPELLLLQTADPSRFWCKLAIESIQARLPTQRASIIQPATAPMQLQKAALRI